MNDDTPIPPPQSAAESAAALRAARAEQQRQQRVLQLEEMIDATRRQLERHRSSVEGAEQRLAQARARADATDAELVELERELASLQPSPPSPDDEAPASDEVQP